MNARRIIAPALFAALVFAWPASAASPSDVTSSVATLTFSAFVGSESLPQKVTFTNTGEQAIEVHGATMTADEGNSFAVRDDCLTTLQHTQRCTVVVIFSPHSAGPATATLEYAGSKVAISGTGIPARR